MYEQWIFEHWKNKKKFKCYMKYNRKQTLGFKNSNNVVCFIIFKIILIGPCKIPSERSKRGSWRHWRKDSNKDAFRAYVLAARLERNGQMWNIFRRHTSHDLPVNWIWNTGVDVGPKIILEILTCITGAPRRIVVMIEFLKSFSLLQ